MFIQRLQRNDIAQFLNERYTYDKFSMIMEYKYTNDPFIYVLVTMKDKKIDGRLYDFENLFFAGDWQKFLYNKFGTEYLFEYKKYLERKNELKIKNLIKKEN